MAVGNKKGKRWSRDELLLAMNLYCEIPYGTMHARNPKIITLAQALGRSPDSIAMKLCNFASLDPFHQARGIKGLQGTSQADREIWTEFHSNWEKLATESESLRLQTLGEIEVAKTTPQRQPRLNQTEVQAPALPYSGPTEKVQSVKVRLAQNFFRRTVLGSYGTRCCISGISLPELLIASHILPWNRFPDFRTNPHNGLCLSRLHDGAFDRGLITLDEDHRVVLSQYLKDALPNKALEMNFVVFEGIPIRLPEKFRPEPNFLKQHREEIFLG